MHEMSVALEICRMAEERIGPEALPQLVEVGVEIGSDSGLEPESLKFCLEALLSAPPFANARPMLDLRAGDVLRLTYLELDDGNPDD
jgi:Zn finger protein HypA/HybF involved in hydrogenase expression